MKYNFGEYIKKKESKFLNTIVKGTDLIRISDANNYFFEYNKQLELKLLDNNVIKELRNSMSNAEWRRIIKTKLFKKKNVL